MHVFHFRRWFHIHSVKLPVVDGMIAALQKTVEVKCSRLDDHSREIRLNERSYLINRVTKKTQNGIKTKRLERGLQIRQE